MLLLDDEDDEAALDPGPESGDPVPRPEERGFSLAHGGSPLLENSLSRRNEMVSRMMDALSSCDVMAGGSGSILASS